jgi:cyanophycinase
MRAILRRLLGIGIFLAAGAPPTPQAATVVGPPRGTVIVVGGGAIGPDIWARFIAAAGGPDALIIDVPTAGGDSVYPPDWRGLGSLKRAGARNLVVLHTKDRRMADSDSFAHLLSRAGGVWFEGGRQWHLVDSYAGTRTEQGFHALLARGGVVGGSSAGASILSSYLLRGARSGNAVIMAPGYEKGFGFLRQTAIDQHVVARERLRDLADSLLPKHPELLAISEDEGTAWVVRGDTAEIVGRNKAFAYNGAATDSGAPFLTLYPGDVYNLGTRAMIRRASEGTGITRGFVDSAMRSCAGKCTVLVAREGKVFAARGYRIPSHPKYQPVTTVPNFPLGGIGAAFAGLVSQLRGADTGTYNSILTRRVYGPVGLRRTLLDSAGAEPRFSSSVDELYRLELGLQFEGTWIRDTLASDGAAPAELDPTRGWARETVWNRQVLALYAEPAGRRGAFLRVPDRKASVIGLSDQGDFDARSAALVLLNRLLGGAP